MPLSKEYLQRRPANWESEIRPRILCRAGQRIDVRTGEVLSEAKCEKCGVTNHSWVVRDRASGEFVEMAESRVDAREKDIPLGGLIQIVLTIAHVHDPSPENVSDENLAAWCQACHNRHDAPARGVKRSATVAKTKLEKGGQSLLFPEGIDNAKTGTQKR